MAKLKKTWKQKLLEETDALARLKLLSDYISDELEVLRLGKKLQSDVKKEMDREQREYYLRQQLKAIKRELGEDDDRTLEIDELRSVASDGKSWIASYEAQERQATGITSLKACVSIRSARSSWRA